MKDHYRNRKSFFLFILFIFPIIYVIRLFNMQIINYERYAAMSISNIQRKIIIYPPRGLIYDRNKKILAGNQIAYDLLFIPFQSNSFDTLELANILNVSTDFLKNQINKAYKYSAYLPSIIVSQLNFDFASIIKEKLYKFKGFYLQPRYIRYYPYSVAANLLGYVGEVDKKILKKHKEYKIGDLIGITGLERSYENYLKGRKGVSIVLVDAYNRVIGKFAEGRYDTAAIPGKNIITTIDLDLQLYAEQLMKGKCGSIVAIEPSTGEVLVLVSSPTYDPNLLCGYNKNKNFKILKNDPNKPFFNRAIMATYPPGSTFKLANALICLNEKIINKNTTFKCYNGHAFGPLFINCHPHSPVSGIVDAIAYSCNSYFSHIFLLLLNNKNYKNTENAYKKWYEYVLSFGFGEKLNIDLPSESKGIVPTIEYYNKHFGKGKWKPLTVISLGIGQAELSLTPLQLANFTCILANRGYYIKPHLVKTIEDTFFNSNIYKLKNFVKIKKEYIDIVIEGMEKTIEAGTAKWIKIDGIKICGKTGTAQNPHGKDHSLFIAFAPKEDPKIAICVIVENSGFGASYAAPIASLIIEKYLNKEVKRKELEKKMMECNLIDN